MEKAEETMDIKNRNELEKRDDNHGAEERMDDEAVEGEGEVEEDEENEARKYIKQLFDERNHEERLNAIVMFPAIRHNINHTVLLLTICQLLQDRNCEIVSAVEQHILEYLIKCATRRDIEDHDNQSIDEIRERRYYNYQSGMTSVMFALYQFSTKASINQYRYILMKAIDVFYRVYVPTRRILSFAINFTTITEKREDYFLNRHVLDDFFVDTDEGARELRKKAVQIMIWQHILEFIHTRKGESDSDKQVALERFLPNFAQMRHVLEKALTYCNEMDVKLSEDVHLEDEEKTGIYDSFMNIIISILKSFKFQAQKNMEEWRSVLFNMLFNFYYDREIIKTIVIELIELFDEPDAFFGEFLTELERMNNRRPDELSRASTLYIGQIAYSYGEEDNAKLIEGRKKEHKLAIMSSAFRTGKITMLGPNISKLYYDVIGEALEREEGQALAIQCVGYVGLFDAQAADSHLRQLFRCCLKPDYQHTKEYLTLLSIVTNWCVADGYTNVHQRIRSLAHPPGGNSWSLIESLQNILIQEETAAECLRKLLNCSIKRMNNNLQKRIVDIILVQITRNVDDVLTANIRRICISALYRFALSSDTNQRVFVEVFVQFFVIWMRRETNKNSSTAQALSMFPKLAARFARWTKNVHFNLIMRTLESWTYVRMELHHFYLELLKHIKLEEFSKKDLRQIVERSRQVTLEVEQKELVVQGKQLEALGYCRQFLGNLKKQCQSAIEKIVNSRQVQGSSTSKKTRTMEANQGISQSSSGVPDGLQTSRKVEEKKIVTSEGEGPSKKLRRKETSESSPGSSGKKALTDGNESRGNKNLHYSKPHYGSSKKSINK